MTPPDTLSRCEAVVTPAPTGVQLRLECETVGLAPYRAHGTDSRPRSIWVCPRVVPKGRADRPFEWQTPSHSVWSVDHFAHVARPLHVS